MSEQIYTARIDKENNFYHAECVELGVNANGLTIEEALENLRAKTIEELKDGDFELPPYPIVRQFTIAQTRKDTSFPAYRKMKKTKRSN